MSAPLTLAYRPHAFREVVGQGHIKPILRAIVASQDPPPVLIMGGTRGTGKTTSARILAAALNCPDYLKHKGDACGECSSCKSVQQTNSIAVLEVDAASNGNVDDIRKIKDLCSYAVDDTWRVVLLDEAHSMSKQAFNALLKLLEEPPPKTVFVLLTTEVDKILETVRSRAMYFEFRRMTIKDIVGRLKHIAEERSIAVEDALLVEIANKVQGGMRDAVMLLDQVSRVGISDVAGFHELFGISNIADDVFEAALEGDHARGSALIEEHFYRVGDASGLVSDLVLLVRDLLVLRAGGSLPSSGPALRLRREGLARRVETVALVSVIQVMWDLKTRVRAVDNDQRSAMEMAFVLISDALNPAPRAGVPMTQAEPAKKLGLADLQRLAGART